MLILSKFIMTLVGISCSKLVLVSLGLRAANCKKKAREWGEHLRCHIIDWLLTSISRPFGGKHLWNWSALSCDL